MNPVVLEWIGYVASLIVLISLLMSSLKKLRWINLGGALLFGIYGFMIGSIPTGLMNVGIVMIDAFYLAKMYMSKEFFRILPIQNNSEYLKNFLEFNKVDIKKYNHSSIVDLEQSVIKLFILRNMNPAGVFICNEYDKKTLEITFDYVIPLFRDFKIGQFIFEKQKLYFLGKGYNKFVVFTDNLQHINYLKKMGFVKTKLRTKTCYVASIK